MTDNSSKCCPDQTSSSCCAPKQPPEQAAASCCSSQAESETNACCPPVGQELQLAGYSIYPFVSAWRDTSLGKVPQVTSKLSWRDRRGRWAMRWGLGRDRYLVSPGLYAVGKPDAQSPLLISANYKLSFDCLRAALKKVSAWILVIDTKGINVWCAAGKGTFGTAEIIRRVTGCRLSELVSHRQLVVPQLGAPGIAAHTIKQETGFTVVYGPVRATDLMAFLSAEMQATPAMRQVSFNFWERLVLTPVEITILYKQILVAILLLLVLSGIGPEVFSISAVLNRGLAAVTAGLAGVLTGCVLTPILLPWIPGRAFALKGALLGLFTATALTLGLFRDASLSGMMSLYLLMIAIASYTAMNFTGSTTFTSPSGVEKEMRVAIPCQAGALLLFAIGWIAAAF